MQSGIKWKNVPFIICHLFRIEYSEVISVEYSLVLSLSQRKMHLKKMGQVIKSYPVGIGKSATPTPPGHYKIQSKVPNPGGVFGAMWMGLSLPDYGIHGTNNPQSIGKQVSKGCIRMHNQDVLELSKIVPVGTTITIHP